MRRREIWLTDEQFFLETPLVSALTIALFVFLCVFSGAVIGMVLRSILPEHHLNAESRDIVKLGTGLIGTMSALVLGLMVASAKSAYDDKKAEVTRMSADIIFLDRVMAHYGPEMNDIRLLLRRAVTGMIERIWSPQDGHGPPSTPASAEGERLFDAIHEITPKTELQRAMLAEAQNTLADVSRTRLLLMQQAHSSISVPFLVIVVCWLSIIFISFGLFAPRNATVIVTLLLCALSVSGALYLIMELDRPFEGLIQISSAPLRDAIGFMGR
jgi:hypothetical protein